MSTVVGGWVETAAQDLAAFGELAREVGAAVAAHQREIRRTATDSGRDLVQEGRSLAFDIADLADAAKRARSDRRRGDHRGRSGRKW
ncbi:hypothetical protein [Nocardia sp. MW-W600-9]